MEIDWRAAVHYVTRQSGWRRTLAVGGLLMLLLPPLGWVLALGYRSLVANRLIDRRLPILPRWRGNVLFALRRGAASSGVILFYLAPFLGSYWGLGVQSAAGLAEHSRELAAFVAGVIILPPLAIPTLPVWYAMRYEWLSFSREEVAVLMLVFFTPIALLPAAFLQVAQHHRFTAAFNLIAAVRLVSAAPRAYVEAWIVSLTISAGSVLVVPLTPWLLFWSYLVISHAFLQVLARTDNLAARVTVLAHLREVGSASST